MYSRLASKFLFFSVFTLQVIRLEANDVAGGEQWCLGDGTQVLLGQFFTTESHPCKLPGFADGPLYGPHSHWEEGWVPIGLLVTYMALREGEIGNQAKGERGICSGQGGQAPAEES